MQRYSSVTLHVSQKNRISAEKLKWTFSKIQILPKNFFLSGLVHNKLKLNVFKMAFMTIQLKLTVPNKWGFRSHNIKHLNTVLNLHLWQAALCTLHIVHYTLYWKCPWIWTCTLHNTHWTLDTAHHMFTLHVENVSLHTENIQNLPVLDLTFTW